MAYSSESCMVSKKKANKIRMKEIITKERREKLKRVFVECQKKLRETKG
jgi:hypothetical protein